MGGLVGYDDRFTRDRSRVQLPSRVSKPFLFAGPRYFVLVNYTEDSET